MLAVLLSLLILGIVVALLAYNDRGSSRHTSEEILAQFPAHIRKRSPRGSLDEGRENPSLRTGAFDIVPATRIGPFYLHRSWDEVDALLVEVYDEINNGPYKIMAVPPYTFHVDTRSDLVEAIIVWPGFLGAYASYIRIGVTLREIAAQLQCNLRRPKGTSEFLIEGVDGISFLTDVKIDEAWEEDTVMAQNVVAIRIQPAATPPDKWSWEE